MPLFFSQLVDMRRLLFLLLLSSSTAMALDGGPRIEACDYRLSSEGRQKNDVCLTNSFINMGISSFSFEPIRSNKIFRFSTNFLSLEPVPSRIGPITTGDGRALFHNAKVYSDGKLIWEGTYKKFSKGVEAQCRPASYGATKYLLENGDYLCVWDKN